MPKHKLKMAVHLFLFQEGKTLLQRRFNTGYEDGNYSVVAGHVDPGETATMAMIRESAEEAGISILENDLNMVHMMHRKSDEERIDLFFIADKWEGTPKIMEINKCDELEWYDLEDLPTNIIPYVRSGLKQVHKKNSFSEFGWD
jgi:8-oxo-dGTP diphosphatase